MEEAGDCLRMLLPQPEKSLNFKFPRKQQKRQKRVLCVDENEMMCNAYLRRVNGLESRFAHSPDEAGRLLSNESFGVAVLDFSVLGSKAPQLIYDFFVRSPETQILIVSSSAHDAKVQLREAGINLNIIEKPNGVADVRQALAALAAE